MNTIHVRSHSQLFLRKYAVIFRCFSCVSNVANFELTEKNNIFQMFRGVDKSKVPTLWGRGASKTYESVQGEEGVQRSMKLGVRTF